MSRKNFTQSVEIDVISYARFSKASMKTTLVDGRDFFLLLNPFCCFGNLHILFNDRTHFHRYTLCIGRNPPRDVPVENFDKIRANDETSRSQSEAYLGYGKYSICPGGTLEDRKSVV